MWDGGMGGGCGRWGGWGCSPRFLFNLIIWFFFGKTKKTWNTPCPNISITVYGLWRLQVRSYLMQNSKLEYRGYTYVRTCHYLTNFNLFLILFSRFVCDLIYGWMESRWKPLDHCSICSTMIIDSWMNRYVCVILPKCMF